MEVEKNVVILPAAAATAGSTTRYDGGWKQGTLELVPSDTWLLMGESSGSPVQRRSSSHPDSNPTGPVDEGISTPDSSRRGY
ncbi:hypothetical protein OUZ56_022280 [Daphnia magna]|uniref:Uncharacterized protein n=1 Tax=Daphnia magna TaxID=35525 RepID=A0ABR0AW12_9CRUS|nr:hypothetical protein OUZ56_022280 [Daphnia magna]